MGNNAIIKAKDNDNKGVYLHWNGGRDSVEAFLEYCKLRGFRDFNDDYGLARFVQVVGNFLGGDGLSIGVIDGVESIKNTPTYNGIYIVDGWDIVGRESRRYDEQKEHDLKDMLIEIDEAQPIKQQLGDFLTSEEVKTKDIKIGDIVYMKDTIKGLYDKFAVVGIGEDKILNGTKVKGLPYVKKYFVKTKEVADIDAHRIDMDFTNNINNYITKETVRIEIQ